MRPSFPLAVALALTLFPGALQAQPSLCGGASATLLDNSRVGGGLSASITLSDLDGDGTLEILSGDAQGNVHIWNADGRRRQQWPKSVPSGAIFGSPSVADINGDGQVDVVVTSLNDAVIHAWRASGGVVSGFPLRIGGVDEAVRGFRRPIEAPESVFLRGGAMLTDLDGDAVPDVVAGATHGLIHGLTEPFPDEAPGWPVQGPSNFQVTPVSADLDGDGSSEIVLHGGNAVSVFRADGTPFPGWPRSPGLSHTNPALGDLDGDGTPEVVVAADSTLSAFRSNGSLLFGPVFIGNDQFLYSSIALGDVTGDGLPEIFIGTEQGAIWGFGGNGANLPGWPVEVGPGPVNSSPLIVDLDGDGSRDVLVLAERGATLHALGADGSPICPLVTLGGAAFASPAVGDLDGDGLGEVVAPTFGGGIFLLGLPGAWTPSRAPWPMYLANERHTGELP